MPQINAINSNITTINATTTTATIIKSEKIDPLARIQEEIKEMTRREQEYRQLITTNGSASINNEMTDLETKDIIKRNENGMNEARSESSSPTAITTASMASSNDDCSSSMPSSLVMSVSSNSNSSTKDDDHHSDDSGISASSTNGVSANIKKFNNISTKPLSKSSIKETRYIRPNCYNIIPEPPQQKLLTRAVSTPHLNAIKPMRHFNVGPAQKGVMQRFIAARGKLQLHNNNNNNNNNTNNNNGGSLMGLSGIGLGTTAPPNTPAINNEGLHYGIINNLTITSPIIERDSEGRPIRPGYVPVELKIQRELQDLKSRENELKKIRKIRESTSDLLNSIDNENVETGNEADDDDDDNVEHCYGPRKLRAAKSIGDIMCDASQHNSLTNSMSPIPDCDKLNSGRTDSRNGSSNNYGGMRPAMSLAQLCDLDPDEAPSSRGLIAQWESLIQKNA